jgi:hypothetical protein
MPVPGLAVDGDEDALAPRIDQDLIVRLHADVHGAQEAPRPCIQHAYQAGAGNALAGDERAARLFVDSYPLRGQADGDRTHRAPAAYVQHAHDRGTSVDVPGRGDNDTPGSLVNHGRRALVPADRQTMEDGSSVRIEHVHARAADADGHGGDESMVGLGVHHDTLRNTV